MTGANASELREAARYLVSHPLVIAEDNPDVFALIRRHAQELDRNFSRRFGYRLRVKSDAARLYKSTVVTRRPFTTGTNKRPFKRREYTMLALALAVMAAGQRVISLKELINGMRSAAVEADVRQIEENLPDRRAIVHALRWLENHGIVEETHMNIERYEDDPSADAILAIHHDRAKLLPLPVLSSVETADQLLDRSEQRERTRVRSYLLEEPVVYREDLTETEWRDYRNYRYREERMFEEMFGLYIETRAEGMAAIDGDGRLTDVQFPRGGGTLPQAALLLIDQLSKTDRTEFTRGEVVKTVEELVEDNRRYWSAEADHPERLTDLVLELLAGHRLAETRGDTVLLLPAAWRYMVEVEYEQASLL